MSVTNRHLVEMQTRFALDLPANLAESVQLNYGLCPLSTVSRRVTYLKWRRRSNPKDWLTDCTRREHVCTRSAC